MNFMCPVCHFGEMPYPPRDYHICPCCGTEFGNDDQEMSHAELRVQWAANGAHWFFGLPPLGWNGWMQLLRAGYPGLLPNVPINNVPASNDSQTVRVNHVLVPEFACA